MITSKNILKIVTAGLLFAATSGTVSADVTEEVANDITISGVALETFANGEMRLKFVAANDGAEAQYLTGVHVDGASNVRLVYYSSHGVQETVGRLALLPDEEVDFSTSHMKAIVTGLPSGQGNGVSFDLLFERGAASSTAHRH